MYTNVRVTNICSDGTLYCQVPCKGLSKLNDLLHKIEDYFHCKVRPRASASEMSCNVAHKRGHYIVCLCNL